MLGVVLAVKRTGPRFVAEGTEQHADVARPPDDSKRPTADSPQPVGAPQPIDPPLPGEQLAGLTLLARAVLDLQKQGVERLLVVVDRPDHPAVAALRTDSRLRATIEELVVPDAVGAAAFLEALRERVHEPFLLARHDIVVDSALYRDLAAPLPDGTVARLATRAGVPVGVLHAQAALLGLVRSFEPTALAALLAQGAPAAIGMDVGAAHVVPLVSGADRRAAVAALFEACRKPVDGLVSRHLNRHVSLFLSRRLVGTPVSPNAMTMLTFLVGVAGAAVALRGGYVPTLVGAALMQINSILDGVDGELARVRHQYSKLGQWLDTIGDDSTNVLFYAALAVGARAEPHGMWLSMAGWLVAATGVLAALLYYTELAGSGSGDLYSIEWEFEQGPPASLKDRLLSYGHLLLKQDTFIFLWLCAALAGTLHQTLPVFALGGVIVVIAATLRRVSRWLRRRG